MKWNGIGVLALALASVLAGASGGTTVVGEEAREVFNTLIAAGATRTEIPEGPTVIIDELTCSGKAVNGEVVSGECQLLGDPRLKRLDGAMGLRLLKGLINMGLRQKIAEGHQVLVALTGLDCGVLHNPGQGKSNPQSGQASCFFVDSN